MTEEEESEEDPDRPIRARTEVGRNGQRIPGEVAMCDTVQTEKLDRTDDPVRMYLA